MHFFILYLFIFLEVVMEAKGRVLLGYSSAGFMVPLVPFIYFKLFPYCLKVACDLGNFLIKVSLFPCLMPLGPFTKSEKESLM